MLNFSEYKGEVVEKCPIDYGHKIMKLNWSMSSSQLDQYIYQNDKGDLFHVCGVLQHTSHMMEEYRDDSRLYHLALVVPIKNRFILSEYLDGKRKCSDIFNKSGSTSYLLKLSANPYNIWRGEKQDKVNYSMHPVKDGEEVTRKYECELSEFTLYECKICPTKTLPYLYNPANWWGDYKFRKKLSFIFISDEEKDKIKDFIKQTNKILKNERSNKNPKRKKKRTGIAA